MVRNKKNKKIMSLWISIPLFLYSWSLFLIASFKLSNLLIYLIKFPMAFGLFIFPILFAMDFLILLFSLFFASQISEKLKQLKIIKK